MAKVEKIVDIGAKLGEGPTWDEKTGTLYWVDIIGKKIIRTNVDNFSSEETSVSGQVGMMCLTEDGKIVCALETGIHILENGSERLLWENPENTADIKNRFNDGKCDPKGRLFVGTISKNPSGALYRFDKDGPVKMISNVSTSNGLDWSPDLKYMYFIDTPSGKLRRFEYDVETGNIHNPIDFIDYTCDNGMFDGMTLDADGCLWIAHWNGYKISKWDPISGKKLEEIEIPTMNVTSCAFGGADMKTLYITTATDSFDKSKPASPGSGALYAYQTDVKGRYANRMKMI